jgi:hypothetical protein
MPPRKRNTSTGARGASNAPAKGATKSAKETAKAPAKKRAAKAPAGSEPPSGGRGRPTLTRNPDADPVRIHREYVQRRLAGGALPTPEAYERAIDEWHSMSGSVRGPAGEVHEPDQAVSADRLLMGSGEVHTEIGLVISDDDEAAIEKEVGPKAYDGPLPATDPGDNSPYEEGQS